MAAPPLAPPPAMRPQRTGLTSMMGRSQYRCWQVTRCLSFVCSMRSTPLKIHWSSSRFSPSSPNTRAVGNSAPPQPPARAVECFLPPFVQWKISFRLFLRPPLVQWRVSSLQNWCSGGFPPTSPRAVVDFFHRAVVDFFHPPLAQWRVSIPPARAREGFLRHPLRAVEGFLHPHSRGGGVPPHPLAQGRVSSSPRSLSSPSARARS